MSSQLSFLEELAAQLYTQYGHHNELTVVLPHGRAGMVFKQFLAAPITQPIWSPQILSIEGFMQQLSPLRQASSLPLTYALYQAFQTLQPREESFEQFYFWGAMLLQDFDVIDKYLVDAAHLFTNLSKQKQLSQSYDYLTEAQRTAIQSFWKSFEERVSNHQREFLQLWKLLPRVYEYFKKDLQVQGIGYQGLCYRSIYEGLTQGTLKVNHRHLIFAGFNALSPVEEKILAWCKENVPTDFYWDLDAYYIEDVRQEAGDYLRTYQYQPHFRTSFPQPLPKRLEDPSKHIELTAVASEVGQAQVIGTQLQALIDIQGAAFKPNKTAIVVANEQLFLPLLHALPLELNQVNITIEYPVKSTAIYRLVEHLLDLQVAVTHEPNLLGYLATQQVLAILSHPHVLGCDQKLAQHTIHHIRETKAGYVAQADLVNQSTLYQALFKALDPKEDILQYLLGGLQAINTHAKLAESPMLPIEKQALQQLLQQLSSLRTTLAHPLSKVTDFVHLFRQLMRTASLPLANQSLAGIHILSIMETKNLDFDNIFIMGMNEGHFPAQMGFSSFIPYNLRKGYGLPIADQYQASLYAYHFYRLLQRAQHVYITYSTQTSVNKQAEMSRYLWQLLYESKLAIKKHVAVQPTYIHTAHPIVIPKKEHVLDQLAQFTVHPNGSTQGLTPSALNTYLDCSLRFYFKYIAQIKEPQPPQQEVNSLVFGNLLHKVMKKLYAQLILKKQHQLIQQEDIRALQKCVALIIQDTFAHAFHQGQKNLLKLQGQHVIAQAVMTKLVTRILKIDQAYAPFQLISLETAYEGQLRIDAQVNQATIARLRGTVDRVDLKEGVVRVLDYKTGLDEKQVKNIPALFDQEDSKRNKAAFQTFLYVWLVQKNYPTPTHKIVPGLINTRQVFEEKFDPRFFIKERDSNTYRPMEHITSYQDEFEEGLGQTIASLFDSAIPFAQTPDETRCSSCPYKGICQRH